MESLDCGRPNEFGKRRGYAIDGDRGGKEACVPSLVSAPPAKEACQLRVDGPATLRRLILQTPKRLQLVLVGDDSLDRVGTEGSYEFAFEIRIAHEDVLHHALEMRAFVTIDQAHDALARQSGYGSPSPTRTADRHDPPSHDSHSATQDFQDDSIALSLDEDDSH